jgi:potassium voltage-gated channel Eag-related subfamily H member 8
MLNFFPFRSLQSPFIIVVVIASLSYVCFLHYCVYEMQTFMQTTTTTTTGKGDLVGCDISLNLMNNHQPNVMGTGGQDFILKSSSDVKVGQT